METVQAGLKVAQRKLLQLCPLPATAPFEIYGARDRGCLPGDDYAFNGFRYIQDASRDVLVREDVGAWLAARSAL